MRTQNFLLNNNFKPSFFIYLAPQRLENALACLYLATLNLKLTKILGIALGLPVRLKQNLKFLIRKAALYYRADGWNRELLISHRKPVAWICF